MSDEKNFNEYLLPLSKYMACDIPTGYFLPFFPRTLAEGFRFNNAKQYRLYDFKDLSVEFNDSILPQAILSVFGDEVPVLLDNEPPLVLSQHWKKWMPDFASPVYKKIEDGFADEHPVMTVMAMEMLPANKHCIDPDLIYKLQLKSTIPEIGVPCAQLYGEGEIKFPCFVKVDQSLGGMGNFVARDEDELAKILKKVRETAGWDGNIVIQEMIKDIVEIPNLDFYLKRSGEIVWIGSSGGVIEDFAWKGAAISWDKQEHYFDLVYEEFTKPIARFLHKKGYFGIVNFEVLVTKTGMYLTDLNPRMATSTYPVLGARYLAKFGFQFSIFDLSKEVKCSGKELLELADSINSSGAGRVIVMALADTSSGCLVSLFVSSKSMDDARSLRKQIINN